MKYLLFLFLVGCGSPKSDSSEQPQATPAPANELYYHGGQIGQNVTLKTVFWGISWTQNEEYTGIRQFLGDLNNSSYLATANEYLSQNGLGPVNVPYDGTAWWDSNVSESLGDTANSLAAEACKVTENNPDPNSIYIFYADNPALPEVDFCAWHSWFECNGIKSMMIYVPNSKGDQECDPEDNTSGHSEALASMANLSAHEIMETVTNPYTTAWYDDENTAVCKSGDMCEIGDKCAWTFNEDSSGKDILVKLNNSEWKLQMLWSNKAYNEGTGRANEADQYGCVIGE